MINKIKLCLRERFGNNPWGVYYFSCQIYVFIMNIFHTVKGFVLFLEDRQKFIRLAEEHGMTITGYFPNFKDRFENAGNVQNHYFLQDLYMARKVLESGTKEHYDIGSNVSGFLSHLLSSPQIDKVTMLDVRPFPIKLEKMDFIQTDATLLKELADNSINSISTLHAIEHFGLGRYGDPIDPESCFKTMKSIQRVLAHGGSLYLSTPVSFRDEIWFNSQRKFAPLTIIKQFNELKLTEFLLIKGNEIISFSGDDAIRLIEDNSLEVSCLDCGLFIFIKPL